MVSAAHLPRKLAEIRDEFLALEKQERLLLLLEFANELPPLPERYANSPELFERVVECQAPVSISVEIDADDKVHLYATAPSEAPTTRGFASILAQGVDGLSPQDVLALPEDYPRSLGLTETVSLLRIAGMTGLLYRAKNQVRNKVDG